MIRPQRAVFRRRAAGGGMGSLLDKTQNKNFEKIQGRPTRCKTARFYASSEV
jgi:hypothetical protein